MGYDSSSESLNRANSEAQNSLKKNDISHTQNASYLTNKSVSLFYDSGIGAEASINNLAISSSNESRRSGNRFFVAAASKTCNDTKFALLNRIKQNSANLNGKLQKELKQAMKSVDALTQLSSNDQSQYASNRINVYGNYYQNSNVLTGQNDANDRKNQQHSISIYSRCANSNSNSSSSNLSVVSKVSLSSSPSRKPLPLRSMNNSLLAAKRSEEKTSSEYSESLLAKRHSKLKVRTSQDESSKSLSRPPNFTDFTAPLPPYILKKSLSKATLFKADNSKNSFASVNGSFQPPPQVKKIRNNSAIERLSSQSKLNITTASIATDEEEADKAKRQGSVKILAPSIHFSDRIYRNESRDEVLNANNCSGTQMCLAISKKQNDFKSLGLNSSSSFYTSTEENGLILL